MRAFLAAMAVAILLAVGAGVILRVGVDLRSDQVHRSQQGNVRL